MLTERSARVVAAVKLHRHAGRRRARRFLVEGANLVEAAARHDLVRDVFVTEAGAERYAALLRAQQAAVHLVTERAARALSETVTPCGLVAVCEPPATGIDDVLAAGPRLVVVTVGIGEPGNAGTVIRIADAMGAGAVILTADSVDPYNGKCLRASAGSIFSVPVVEAPEARTVVAALRAAGLRVLATTLDGEPLCDDVVGELTQPTAWLFGSEAHGLPDDLAAMADNRIRIPMFGDAESLNVAAAAAICLHRSACAQHRHGAG
jgi:TrmH family RNA methyltransferase